MCSARIEIDSLDKVTDKILQNVFIWYREKLFFVLYTTGWMSEMYGNITQEIYQRNFLTFSWVSVY